MNCFLPYYNAHATEGIDILSLAKVVKVAMAKVVYYNKMHWTDLIPSQCYSSYQ